jgi:uncharacterized protein YukE
VAGVYDARAAQEAQKAREQQRRQQILAQTHGGHNGIKGFTTNFEAAGGLHNLKNMIDNAQPDALDHVVTRWEAINTALSTAQQDLIKHTAAALQTWSGPAAQQFNQRSAQLQQSLGNAAEYATQTASAVREAATALRTAKTQMDGIHDAGFWDKASRWGATSDSQFKADLKSGIDLGTALQLDGSQLNAEEQRHQQAVLVMEQLGAGYNNSSSWLSKNRPPIDEPGPVYPPGPPITHQPVTRPGGTPTSPHSETVTPGSMTGGSNVRGAGDIKSLGPNPGAGMTGTGGVTPVSGGTVSKLPSSPVTSVDGISGGVPLAAGTGGWGGGAGGAAGLGGLGAGGGAGFGGSSLPGLGLGAAGLGAAGGLGDHLAAEGAAGEEGLAAERALAGEEAAGRGEGAGANGMMGGMGGLGRGNGRKNKRKQRAAYLVEDEETWQQAVTPNPPVIG